MSILVFKRCADLNLWRDSKNKRDFGTKTTVNLVDIVDLPNSYC